MIRQGRGGSVVNLISRATQGLRDYSAYAAAKGAILSATFTWALELAREGIRVNALSPAARYHEPGAPVNLRMPWTREAGQTAEQMREMTPPPESVAPLVVYLASEISHWVSGQAFFLAGDSLALVRHPMETQIAQRPEGWDVDFVLHAERATVVEVACEGGKLTKLRVSPESRRKDLVFVQDYCRPSDV